MCDAAIPRIQMQSRKWRAQKLLLADGTRASLGLQLLTEKSDITGGYLPHNFW
jgi:hypothetical protein